MQLLIASSCDFVWLLFRVASAQIGKSFGFEKAMQLSRTERITIQVFIGWNNLADFHDART